MLGGILMAVLVEGCEGNWGAWTGNGSSADCYHGQGPFWGGAIWTFTFFTDVGRKAGSKKSILVDAAGGPLSVAVAGAATSMIRNS